MTYLRRIITILALAMAAAAIAADNQPDSVGKNKYLVAVINLEGMVDGLMERILKRKIDQALEDGADALLFEITTDGGRLDSGMEIAKLIDKQKIRTVVFVEDKVLASNLKSVFLRTVGPIKKT